MDDELKRLQEALVAAVQGMSLDELKQTRAGKWSAAEILEHLCLTYQGTIKGFQKCLKAEKPLGGNPTLKQRLSIAAVTRFGYLPQGRKAPERTVPRGMPVEQVVEQTISGLSAMNAIIGEAEKKYDKRTRVLDHPVLGPLTAKQWRGFHCTHGYHHVKQIRSLRAAE